MSSQNRSLWIITMVVFLFVSSGCHSTHYTAPRDEMNRSGSGIYGDKGQQIVGYTLADGSMHELNGHVSVSGTDSLIFTRKSTLPLDSTKTGSHHATLAIQDVKELQIRVSNPAATVGMVFLTTIGILAVIAGIALATKESCPFLYSFDGENYVFDGEPYGGAVMPSLQRTDYSELEHMHAVDNEYRLAIRNEVDETQHTDALNLAVVDHPIGSMAVMDYAGNVHCFQQFIGLSSAHDEKGDNLLPWLREHDDAGWYPDLGEYAAKDSLLDTRNHITLEFPRPEFTDEVHLVANLGTGQWGSHMIRVMLGMRGDQVGDFYQAVDTDPVAQFQLASWNAREDVFMLDLEVQIGDEWEKRGELHGGGPFISENRSIPLDLNGVEGETVRLRIHPPIGFWRLDSFHLGIDEVPSELARVSAVSAVDQQGQDVRSVLALEDGEYFDQATNEEWAELRFVEPMPRSDMERTIFAVTSGWYEIHLYPTGPPELVALDRLINEPGYVVRRAMLEYRDYLESGKLGYIKPDTMTP